MVPGLDKPQDGQYFSPGSLSGFVRFAGWTAFHLYTTTTDAECRKVVHELLQYYKTFPVSL